MTRKDRAEKGHCMKKTEEIEMTHFMRMANGLEVAYSRRQPDGTVLVNVLENISEDSFRQMTLSLPAFTVSENSGFTEPEIGEIVAELRPFSEMIGQLSEL